MAPALNMQVEYLQSTSFSDVYGNGLEEVDVWGETSGDEEISSPPRSTSPKTNRQSMHPALISTSTSPEMAHDRPPRTPSGNMRKALRTELLQRHKLRKSSGSETDLQECAKQSGNRPHGNILPPMTPRTRRRKGLQMANNKMTPPPVPEDTLSPKPLSAVEKRRQRHEKHLSSCAQTLQETSSNSFFPSSDGSHGFEDGSGLTGAFDSSASSLSLSATKFNASFGKDFSSTSSSGKGHNSVPSLPPPPIDFFALEEESSQEKGNESMSDLQKHIQSVLADTSDDAPSSEPTLERKDKSRRSREEATPSEWKRRPRSTSRARAPRSSRKLSQERGSASTRDSSVPRAGGRIKFVRSSSERSLGAKGSAEDEKSRKSDKSSKSSNSRSSRGQRVPGATKPQRCSSMNNARPSRPQKGPTEARPPRTCSTLDHLSTSEKKRILECPLSPTAVPRRGAGETSRRTRSGSTPRRKIMYVKDTENALRSATISQLEF